MNKYKYLTCLFITLSLISCSSNNNITNLIHTEPAYLGDHQLYGYEKGTLRKNSENKYYVSDRFGFAHYLCVTRATKEPDVLFYSAIDTNISYNKKKETNRLTLEDFEVGEQVIFWWGVAEIIRYLPIAKFECDFESIFIKLNALNQCRENSLGILRVI